MPKNILIKVLGDLTKRKKSINLIKKNAVENSVTIFPGGGTDISFLLKKAGVGFEFIPEVGRVIKDPIGKKLAYDVLKKKQKMLRKEFIRLGIKVVVEIPVIKFGGELRFLNGDNLAEALSVNYDKTFVITVKGRKKKLKGHNLKVIKI